MSKNDLHDVSRIGPDLAVQSALETDKAQVQTGNTATSKTNSKRPNKIALYGLFGLQNWGNECTLQAIIYNVKKFIPDAELCCFCMDPFDTQQRHSIPALPISQRFAKGYPKNSQKQANPLIKILRAAFIRLPNELFSWVKAFQSLRGFDMLVVPGTGLLTDFNSNPLGLPYRILKWSIVAKLRRCKVYFVSVGAGPTSHPLTRWLVRAALSLAQYRSYRDNYSRNFLESIGFKTDHDWLYPDLAFSLPKALFSQRNPRDRARTVIGVGVIDYYGKLGQPVPGMEAKYRALLAKLAMLVTWLLDHNYTVRLLIGDSLSDGKVKQKLLELVGPRESGIGNGELIDQPISSVEDVLAELASTDIVVSPRFHNILLGLMLNKPGISLSYHEKFASLMAGVGLAEYCHDIDELDVEALTKQIMQLDQQAQNLRPYIKQRVEAYRIALDEQYARIFNQAALDRPFNGRG